MERRDCVWKFKRSITLNSQNQDNYDEAIKEWYDTRMTRKYSNIEGHCICGSPLKIEMFMINRFTGRILTIGGSCMGKFPHIKWKKDKRCGIYVSEEDRKKYDPNPEKEHIDVDEYDVDDWNKVSRNNAKYFAVCMLD
jgi:hypothetical protein